ncbi:wsc domain containing protein [Sporothrix brasiliensis 5110]|uniref:Wsc domain containing protein n=1 Tax=Sporothrix brasiliensis 5110 TaxID=1398154 RepID=A0A0C2ESN4_9PEZI|nr:wsc domain containing protein [Sporothrix brasiliensis 5110]KIH89394.1 wsc domain containing protein [Sporothrix brasiliensis 5110]
MFSSLSPKSLATLVAALAAIAPAVSAKDSRTFAVLRFHGDDPLTIGRTDPIVSPGGPSSHVHVVQGGNAFGNSATGESLLKSTCSTANIAGDKSAYWMPQVFFHDPKNGSFEPVPLFYMNVYYFFEATNDDITAFPVGLQMVSGSATRKTAPTTGNDVLDPAEGTIQPAQFTCPRSSYDPPSYPVGSDGSMAGLQDTNNKGAGAGFPFAECDGYASPLRADLHFPSCYDPSKALTDFQSNTAFPTDAGDGKQDCPKGWLHMPHLFYEMYWNTPLFVDRWDPAAADSQPFVLSNGDAAGFSLHGDFLAAWDTTVLQHIIDTCDAGDAGMDQCAGVDTVLKGNCNIPNPTPEDVTGVLSALPGNNPLFGWQYGTGSATGATGATGATSTYGSGKSGSSSSAAAVAAPSSAKASTPSSSPAVVANHAVSSADAKTEAPSPSPTVSPSPSLSPSSPSVVVSSQVAAVSAAPSSSSAVVSSVDATSTGCAAPTDISTTIVTVPVTVYSTSTSAIYQTAAACTLSSAVSSPSAPYPTSVVASAAGAAKRSEHMHRHVHARRH